MPRDIGARVEAASTALALAFVAAMQVYTPLRAAGSDATLFAYGGKLILQGFVPYRDFWDNKPPGIFYVNALGFALSGGHWLGPTVLQALAAVAAAWVFSRLMRDTFDERAPRVVGLWLAALVLSNPFVRQGAHITETYQVLPAALAVWLLRPLAPGAPPRRWAWAGAASSGAFLLKPNAAALGAVAIAACALHLARRRWTWRETVRHGAAYTAGGVGVLAAVTLAPAGAARDLWFATLGYNVTIYSDLFPRPATRAELLKPVLDDVLAFRGLLACVALVPVGVALWRVTGVRLPRVEDAALVAVVWPLADLALNLLNSYAYPHYFYPLALSLPFAAATLIVRPPAPARPHAWALALAPACLGLALVALDYAGLAQAVRERLPRPARAFVEPTAAERLGLAAASYLDPGERPLGWGHHHGELLVLGRATFVPVLSTLHMFSRYGRERWGGAWLAALGARPPVVFDTLGTFEPEGPRLPPPGPARELVEAAWPVLSADYVSLPPEGLHRAFVRRDRFEARRVEGRRGFAVAPPSVQRHEAPGLERPGAGGRARPPTLVSTR